MTTRPRTPARPPAPSEPSERRPARQAPVAAALTPDGAPAPEPTPRRDPPDDHISRPLPRPEERPVLDRETSARLRYPFPTLANPHAAAMQEYTDHVWIDGEWAQFVPPEIADRFKKTRTAYMTSYFYPMATWERLKPLARMMLFSLYQDDIYERARPEVVRAVRERTVAVARGHIGAREADVMLGAQIETLRGELLHFLPAESLHRWAEDLDLYFEGLEAEVTHLEAGSFPSVEEFLWIRERALMLHAFFALKEVETQVVLPSEIHDHPTVRKLKSLAVRLPGWFNEFQSYDKETRTGMGNLNLINVVRHERSCSLVDAREWVFRLHERELGEFVEIQQNLPDFGTWHDAVANHIHHISFVVSGWRGVDAEISRYDPGTYADRHRLAAAAHISRPQTMG
ncbi:terpene synthase family protein [Streptomyces syringium]|uniref:terpene synthase family protein n=1 Tax=Streptomyces syringium TaxID=76729 RepID=UPI0033BED508